MRAGPELGTHGRPGAVGPGAESTAALAAVLGRGLGRVRAVGTCSLPSWFPCPGGGRGQPEEDAADGAGDSERHLQRRQHQIT